MALRSSAWIVIGLATSSSAMVSIMGGVERYMITWSPVWRRDDWLVHQHDIVPAAVRPTNSW